MIEYLGKCRHHFRFCVEFYTTFQLMQKQRVSKPGRYMSRNWSSHVVSEIREHRQVNQIGSTRQLFHLSRHLEHWGTFSPDFQRRQCVIISRKKQRALGMFELFGRTGPPISGGAVCGEKNYGWLKYFLPLLWNYFKFIQVHSMQFKLCNWSCFTSKACLL